MSTDADPTPTDTAPRPAVARFVLLALAWNLLLFTLLRLPLVERSVVLPLARAELDLAQQVFGAGPAPVIASAECSGADAIAMCLGMIFAFPAPLGRRLAGAAVAVLLLVVFNLLRLASLVRAADDPGRFALLHQWVWPALLVLFAAALFWRWLRGADPAGRVALPAAGRFVLLAAVAVLVFLALTPWLLSWPPLLRLAVAEAAMAARLMNLAGIPAEAAGAILQTPREAFEVTGECLATPLLPVALAALFAFARGFRTRLAGLLLALPLFALLGEVRILLLAAPAELIASPEAAAHAFFQTLAALVLVAAATRLGSAQPRTRGSRTGRFGLGVLAGAGLAVLVWPLTALLPSAPDSQGALGSFLAFSLGLWLALQIASGRPLAPARKLVAPVTLLFAASVLLIAAATLAGGLPVLLLRALALLLPAALALRRSHD